MDASATGRMSKRSHQPITPEHLERLSGMAANDNLGLTRDDSKWTDYRGRQVLVVLAQGAARHYLDVQAGLERTNGVKDLDVWSFFAELPRHRLNCERRGIHRDFGPSELGHDRRWPHLEDVERDRRVHPRSPRDQC